MLGGALAMSSTAIVSKMLAERMELGTPHGRDVMGILLFQDLAVVAFLIVIPSLAQVGRRAGDVAGDRRASRPRWRWPMILFLGQAPMRAWFHLVARQRSSELFVLNVLLVTLGLGALTESLGPVAGARRVPRRDADRGDRVPLPGRGGHQAVPRRAARPLLRRRRHGARPVGRARRTSAGSLLLRRRAGPRQARC